MRYEYATHVDGGCLRGGFILARAGALLMVTDPNSATYRYRYSSAARVDIALEARAAQRRSATATASGPGPTGIVRTTRCSRKSITATASIP